MIRRRGRSHTYSYYHNSYKFSTFARGIISSCGSTFRKHLVQHIFKGIPKRRFWYHIWHRGQVCIRYWYALLLGCYLSFVLSSVCDFVFLFSIWICCMFFTIFPQSSKVCSKDIKNVAFVISNGRETSFMSLIFNYMCACLFVWWKFNGEDKVLSWSSLLALGTLFNLWYGFFKCFLCALVFMKNNV